MRETVLINDVGPRDGLQNQAKVLSPEQRLQLIAALADAGLRAIEVGAFVSPKAVPAMAGTDQLVAALAADSGINYSALIPNLKGYQLAREAGVRTVGLVVAASNTMNEKNIRMDTERALSICTEVMRQAANDHIVSQAYIATAWECPFEGAIAERVVLELAERLLRDGADQLVVADTIGAADPAAVQSLIHKLVAEFGAQRFACHFHDTRGMGVANVYAALQEGIRHFDAAIGGLGGCPFAPGATGNVATEDVVLLLEQMGFETGIDLQKLVYAADLAAQLTGNCDGGRSSRWLKRQFEKARAR